MYTCYGDRAGIATPHQHSLAAEARVCYGLVSPGHAVPAAVVHTPATPTAPALPPFGHRAAPRGPLSLSQFNYIRDLGGDTDRARLMSYEEASIYITQLRAEKRGATRVTDPRLAFLKGLLAMVPDGYYACEEYDGGHVEFIRLSTPKKGKSLGLRKIQTVHGSGLGVSLKDVGWYSIDRDTWHLLNKDSLIPYLQVLCVDHQGAAIRYGEKIGRCCRCNAELTDGRSRWYSIGPDCEEIWPHIIGLVEERKGPFTGER